MDGKSDKISRTVLQTLIKSQLSVSYSTEIERTCQTFGCTAPFLHGLVMMTDRAIAASLLALRQSDSRLQRRNDVEKRHQYPADLQSQIPNAGPLLGVCYTPCTSDRRQNSDWRLDEVLSTDTCAWGSSPSRSKNRSTDSQGVKGCIARTSPGENSIEDPAMSSTRCRVS